MEKIITRIKRRNGEAFVKTLLKYDNGIFEIPDIEKIVFFAGKTNEAAEAISDYLITLKGIKIQQEEEPKKECPFDLLDRAGYNAFYADTLKKQNSIRHLYAKGEELCTFNDERRHKNYHIVHAIKKDVENILRENFSAPKREDEYGTSVISIQIAKKGGFISIKNRYNHKVDYCDNTFKSNPDNIIKGLAAALKEKFKVDFSSGESPLPEGYHLAGKAIVKIVEEVGGVFFGEDCYIKDGKLTYVDQGTGDMLMSYFVYSDKNKTLTKIPNIEDSFANDFNKYYGGKKTLHLWGKDLFDGELLIIRCV